MCLLLQMSTGIGNFLSAVKTVYKAKNAGIDGYILAQSTVDISKSQQTNKFVQAIELSNINLV